MLKCDSQYPMENWHSSVFENEKNVTLNSVFFKKHDNFENIA